MKYLIHTLTLTSLLLATSCVTQKNAEKHIMLIDGAATTASTGNTNALSAAATLKSRQKQQPNASATNLSASCKLRLNMGGKELSAGGKLQMKRGSIIRLSARVLGIEVMTLEFTPTGVTAIDRFNHQYATAQYDEVKLIKASGLNFHSLEALFWNEIFLPGSNTQLTEKDFSLFQAEGSANEGSLTLTPTTTPLLNYHFELNSSNLQLTALNVEPKGVNAAANSGKFSATYADFSAKLGSRTFPTQLTLALNQGAASNKTQSLQLSLSSLNTKAEVDATPTKPSSKYKKRTLAELGL